MHRSVQPRIACLTLALGVWQVAFALTFIFFDATSFYNDVAVGLAFVVLGLLSMKWPPFRWGIAIAALWLEFAPLAFWAPEARIYLNDTIIGALAIVFTFVFVKSEGPPEPSVAPKGWSYNPSAWPHRITTASLALICWFFSRYMATYQLGYIFEVYDPFFHDGTLHVITSSVSHRFPVPDAGLGAFAYTLEFLLGWQGGQSRWLHMPWLVFSFAFLIIPVGMASIFLIILQPVIVGAWCSWCLFTAALMLLMIVLTAAEFAAVLQFLAGCKARGESLWVTFWKGGKERAGERPISHRFDQGMGLLWNLVLSAGIGAWLMTSPAVVPTVREMAVSNYIVGPLIISASVISSAEVFRSLRYVNVLFGIECIVVSSIFHSSVAMHVILGIVLAALAFPKGRIRERYGAWGRLIH